MAKFRVAARTPDHAELLICDGLVERSGGDPKHKIVYVTRGCFRLHGSRGGWTILPTHMVFIPAQRPYLIRTDAGTEVAVAHLDPEGTPWHHDGCWVAGVTALAREMILHALRWPRRRAREDLLAAKFFRTLGLLCQDWFSKPRVLWHPSARSPEIERAIAYGRDHPGDAALGAAAAAAGLSTRSLRRRFAAETGMTWRRFTHETRMTRAMELLASGGLRVGEVGRAVGFKSNGAFSEAFTRYAGRTPSAFARDCRDLPASTPVSFERERAMVAADRRTRDHPQGRRRGEGKGAG